MKRLVVALCVFFVLPAANAAKPPKPVDELEARVESLEAAPRPIYVLANGERIGAFLNISDPQGDAFSVISTTGFLFSVSGRFGALCHGTIFFESVGCTGQGYASTTIEGKLPNCPFNASVMSVVFAPTSKIFFPVDFPNYYTVPDSVPTLRQFASKLGSSACTDDVNEEVAIPSFPNDPDITGVPNDYFALPITLGQ